jgi:hypothetical protein
MDDGRAITERHQGWLREIDALWQRCQEDPEQIASLTDASDALLDLFYAATVQVLASDGRGQAPDELSLYRVLRQALPQLDRGRLRRYLADRPARNEAAPG